MEKNALPSSRSRETILLWMDTVNNFTLKRSCLFLFRSVRICSHSVAIAEKLGVLKELVQGVRSAHRAAVTYPSVAGGAGRKGKLSRKYRQYAMQTNDGNSNSTANQAPFTKIWHNNEPLIVQRVADIPEEKGRCGYCGTDFPRGRLSFIPFDVAIAHKERWEYLNRQRKSDDEPVYLPSPHGKMTTRYYCIRRACITKRFPYFTKDLVEVAENVTISQSHKNILKEELDMEL